MPTALTVPMFISDIQATVDSNNNINGVTVTAMPQVGQVAVSGGSVRLSLATTNPPISIGQKINVLINI